MKSPIHFVRIIAFLALTQLAFVACAPKRGNDEPCGFVRNGSNYRVSWKYNVPIKIQMHSSVPTEFKPAILSAMKRWENLSEREFFLVDQIDNRDYPGARDSKNVIYWNHTWLEESPRRQAVTVIHWNNSTISEGDILINAKDFEYSTAASADYNKVDFESLMVHEFGHLLGLTHQDSSTGVMAPMLGYGVIRREPSKDLVPLLSCEY